MHSEAIQPAWFPTAPKAAVGRRWRLAAVLLVAAAAVAGLLLVRHRAQPTRYRTTVVELRSIERQVVMAGHLDAIERIDVPAPLAGHLLEVLVAPGDSVKRGQVLARLDGRANRISARSARAARSAAQGKVAEARALLQAATDALALSDELHQRQLGSDGELATARNRRAAAEAALASARAEAQAAEEAVRGASLVESMSSIVAPAAGIVLRAPEHGGAAVSPEGEPLFEVGSALQELRIDADVAESEVGQVRAGQRASFVVPAYPERVFPAKVVRVGVSARRSAVAVYYPVELRAPNGDSALLPGMTATVRIAVEQAEDVLATKEAALRFRPPGVEGETGRARVWQVTDGTLRPIAVSPGISDGSFTELQPRNAGELSPGMRLAIGLQTDDSAPTAGIRLGNR